jgi:hypothetical protein
VLQGVLKRKPGPESPAIEGLKDTQGTAPFTATKAARTTAETASAKSGTKSVSTVSAGLDIAALC